MRWLLVVVVALFGCKRLSTGAREDFAKKHSCPVARVTVTPRSDLKYGDLVVKESTDEPPEDVKKDPERLAKFKADKAEESSELRKNLNSNLDMFQVKGCDLDVLMGCGHGSSPDGQSQADEVVCFEISKK
ncbi:MAG: hypothetical protein ACXVEF_36440 [Polyangiales bacterium]